jgi:hypothetical protein
MNYRSKDGLTDAIDRLRSELSVIKEELRVIELRKPALESRATRIQEALSTLIGDGSTGDPRWLQMPRITEGGLAKEEDIAAGGPYEPRVREPKIKKQIGPAKRPEISEDAIVAMSYYIQKANHPVKSAELYEYLVAENLMERIDTEMPYKSFAITLRNIRQDYIDYDRNTKTWTSKAPSPKEKLREALEGKNGARVVSSHAMPVGREDNLFVKTVAKIFRTNRFEPMTPTRLYDELTEQREYALIPGAGSLSEFTSTMESFKDFFPNEDGNYRITRQDLAPAPETNGAGAPGLYTVKHSH